MERRLGFIGIIIDDRKQHAAAVNQLLLEFGDLIHARMGLPNLKHGASVITLIVDATTDELGAMTGRLGKLPGISVKSMLSKGV